MLIALAFCVERRMNMYDAKKCDQSECFVIRDKEEKCEGSKLGWLMVTVGLAVLMHSKRRKDFRT